MQLQVRSLTKRYGDTLAVDDLSFDAQPGRVTGFLGRNGAGKSTTMKVLLGLAAPTAGSATFAGTAYAELDDPLGTVGAVLEQDVYHPARTAHDHLRVMAVGAGVPVPRCGEMLELVGLSDAASKRVGGFSLGMKQRLGLAAALLGDPRVLVLDEPGNGLDPQGLRWLRELLRWRAGDGATVVVSSHQLAEVQVLADDLVVIDHGRLVQTTTVAELSTTGVRVRSPKLGTLISAAESAGGQVERRGDGLVLVTGLEAEELGDLAHEHGVPLHELAPETSSLEDAFVGMTGAEGGPS